MIHHLLYNVHRNLGKQQCSILPQDYWYLCLDFLSKRRKQTQLGRTYINYMLFNFPLKLVRLPLIMYNFVKQRSVLQESKPEITLQTGGDVATLSDIMWKVSITVMIVWVWCHTIFLSCGVFLQFIYIFFIQNCFNILSVFYCCLNF